MKNILGICLFCLGLAACAGNPPAWWNPGNIYSPQNKNNPTNAQINVAASQHDTQTPIEQKIDVPNDDYEEMTLTPLQDEEGENDSGESSAQSMPDLEDTLPPPSILN